MDVEDDLREISIKELESEKPENKKLKRLFLIITGIFLVILIVIYLVPGNILYVLEGRLVSEKLNPDFSVNLKNSGRIVFEKAAYEKLKAMYFSNQKNEFKVCLKGKKEEKNYFISDFYVPKTFGQSFSHVSAELCSKETIISLHTHPYKRCIFSEQDIRTYESVRQINPDAVIGLMCEADRFNFYGS